MLLFSGDPAAILGLLAVGALAIGGVVWNAGAHQPAWARLLLLVSVLAAARIAAGAAAAALGALLLTLGALVRIRTEEVILGLAVFGGMVAAVGGAGPKLLLLSWAVGGALEALRVVAAATWRGLRRLPALKSERTRTTILHPES